jgi:hypothetical protein
VAALYETDAIAACEALWSHVYARERGVLCVVDTGEAGGPWNHTYFNYPKTATEAAEWALKKSSAGRTVYFCAHLLYKAKRNKENATAIACLYADLDGSAVPQGQLSPSALVESSPGRYHAYWRLVDSIPPTIAENLNNRLALAIGADASGFDLSQVLRLPGTINRKPEYDEPEVSLVRLEEDRAFVAGDLDKMLPPLPSSNGDHDPEAEPEDGPPVILDREGLEVWYGHRPKYKDDGQVDRSASLMKIARTLYDAGCTRRTIVAALAERDEALHWRCYSGRPDSEKQYHNIVTALHKSRNKPHNHTKFASTTPFGGKGESKSHRKSRRDRRGGDYAHKTSHPKKGLRAVSFSGRTKPDPQDFVVENLIPAELATAFYGPSGLTKSLCVLDLGLHVAFEGVEYWHGLRVQTLPVVFLDFEMSENVQLRRAMEIAEGRTWPDVPRGFRYVGAAGYAPRDVFEFALELVGDLGPSLVITDSFGYSLQGAAEESSDVLGYVREYLQPLQEAGATNLVVDHVSKVIRGEKASEKEQFGSVFKTNSMRSTVHMTGHTDEGTDEVFATLTQKKNNVGKKEKPFTVITHFSRDSITFRLSESVVDPPRTPPSKPT